MSAIYLLILSLFSVTAYTAVIETNSKVITNFSKYQFVDVSGRVGFPGRDGRSAPEVNCVEGMTRQGGDGEDGANGEAGESGSDVFLFTDKLEKLKNIKIDQSGGLGGKGGSGGEASKGCFGGLPGIDGAKGRVGAQGNFGKTFVLPKNFVIPEEDNTRIIDFEKLVESEITLSENKWEKVEGLKSLLASGSNTHDFFYQFLETKSYRVRVILADLFLAKNSQRSKLAIRLENGELSLTTYTGGLLDYKIEKSASGFDIIVYSIESDSRLKDLKLSKLRGHSQDLVLEVLAQNMIFEVESTFAIALSLLDENNDVIESEDFIAIPRALVWENDDGYDLFIGHLYLDEKYKATGARIKIDITVYRKIRGQVRAFGLSGIFKV